MIPFTVALSDANSSPNPVANGLICRRTCAWEQRIAHPSRRNTGKKMNRRRDRLLPSRVTAWALCMALPLSKLLIGFPLSLHPNMNRHCDRSAVSAQLVTGRLKVDLGPVRGVASESNLWLNLER